MTLAVVNMWPEPVSVSYLQMYVLTQSMPHWAEIIVPTELLKHADPQNPGQINKRIAVLGQKDSEVVRDTEWANWPSTGD